MVEACLASPVRDSRGVAQLVRPLVQSPALEKERVMFTATRIYLHVVLFSEAVNAWGQRLLPLLIAASCT